MKLLILLTLILPLKSFAWDCNPNNQNEYAKCLEEVEKHLAGEVTCDPSGAPAPETQCEKKYKDFYADGTVNITYAGGYFDGSPDDGVYGEYWSNLAIEKLTGPCPAKYELLSADKYLGTKEEVNGPKNDREFTGCGKPSTFQNTCGFSRTDNPEILQRKFLIDGKVSAIQVRILSAALTNSDKQNRASDEKLISANFCQKVAQEKLPECIKKNSPPIIPKSKLTGACTKADRYLYQICKSEYVKNAWKESIVNGDEMVIYDGHARDGGGPSFDPPLLLKNGHVNYPWYRSNRPGHKEEAKAFASAAKKGKVPAFYSSLSCNGVSHFYKRGQFPEVSPSTAFVLSKRTSYPDEGLASFLSTIEGALLKQCGEQLDKNISGAGCAFKLLNF